MTLRAILHFLLAFLGPLAVFPAVTVAASPIATPTLWRGLPAHSLTDGKSTAIVVPALGGRLMHFSKNGGPNLLWNGPPNSEKSPPAVKWGGDKTYLGPHSLWPLQHGSGWPPPDPDFLPAAVVPSPNLLATLSAPWPGSGARIQRDYAFATDGALVITHTVAPVSGSREIAALWTVTQIIPPLAAFVPLAASSPYRENVFWFGNARQDPRLLATFPAPHLLQLRPAPGLAYKLGAHPALPALAASYLDSLFLQTAAPQPGLYPEGADGAGLSVEVYHHDQQGDMAYMELEFLSPLRRLDAGLTLATRWSISENTNPLSAPAVSRLLGLTTP